jgi:hypothetical protein
VKRNLFLLIAVALITLVALAIAIPTLTINYYGNEYSIRGIDPKDFKLEFVSQYFGFSPSIDLQGGNLITLNVDLTSIEQDKREAELDKVKSILYWRLWNAKITNFQLNALTSSNSAIYKILIKVPEEIDDNLINLLLTPGNFSVWVQDPNTATDNVTATQNYFKQIFGDRVPIAITNDDVQSVSTVSDSRCYFSEVTKPNNYCVQVIFTGDGQTKLAAAIRAASAAVSAPAPVVVALDYSPVGVQASGQQVLNASDLGRELIIFPLTEDKYLVNSILASMIGSTPLSSSVTLESNQKFSPIMGESTIEYLKISLALGFLAVSALVLYYFKERGRLFVATFAIFLVWSIAIFKILNIALSFYMLSGFVVAVLLFMALLISAEYKIRTAYKGSLTAEEMKAIYKAVSIKLRNLTFASLVIDFLMGYYGTTVTINFMTGFGVGMIIGLMVIILAFKALMPIMLLNTKNVKA